MNLYLNRKKEKIIRESAEIIETNLGELKLIRNFEQLTRKLKSYSVF
jgi:hypothetical protein